MKTDYKNWVPKSYLNTIGSIAIISTTCFIALILLIRKMNFIVALIGLLLLFTSIVALIFYLRFARGYRNFDFSNPDSLSWDILNNLLDHTHLSREDASILDVGCGSGALSIACGKRFPKAKILGVDIWSNMYKSYSKDLCEKNALAENVKNIVFAQDNAMHLSIESESFDCVISNYVYHNIKGDQKAYILDSLRVVKKGGSFAIHDVFNKKYFPNPDDFIKELRDLGFKEVYLISTADGYPIPIDLAKKIGLTDSMLLYGIK